MAAMKTGDRWLPDQRVQRQSFQATMNLELPQGRMTKAILPLQEISVGVMIAQG